MTEEQVLKHIATDDHARRELLWLRAKEKGDDHLARDLERVDPQLVGRLRRSGLDVEERDGESPRERAERMGRLWDECYAQHVASLSHR